MACDEVVADRWLLIAVSAVRNGPLCEPGLESTAAGRGRVSARKYARDMQLTQVHQQSAVACTVSTLLSERLLVSTGP